MSYRGVYKSGYGSFAEGLTRLTRSSTHLSMCRFSLNSKRRPLRVMTNVLLSISPFPQHTPQNVLFLWSPSNPARPCSGTVSLICKTKPVSCITVKKIVVFKFNYSEPTLDFVDSRLQNLTCRTPTVTKREPHCENATSATCQSKQDTSHQ